MLRLPKGLLFPSLIPQNEVSLKNLPGGGKTHLYSLDWSAIEALKEKKWNEQLPCSPSSMVFPGVGPESLISWSNELSFAIPNQFLEEIRHCSLQAAEEWDHRIIPFNRTIMPSITYVLKAFHLLADCLYDSETHYFSRSDKKLILPYALTFRFWSYQIESSFLRTYSCLDDLVRFLDSLSSEPEVQTFGRNLIKEIEDQTKTMVKADEDIKKSQTGSTEGHIFTKPHAVKYTRGDRKGILSAFLSNAKASAEFSESIDFTIPDVGEASLIMPKLQRSAGKIILIAELDCEDPNKALQKLTSTHYGFTFPISDGITSAIIQKATVRYISTTPPPTITFDVDRIIGPVIEKITSQDTKSIVVDGIVKKIDRNKISEAHRDELEHLVETAEEDPEGSISISHGDADTISITANTITIEPGTTIKVGSINGKDTDSGR